MGCWQGIRFENEAGNVVAADAPAHQGVGVTSQLPLVLVVTAEDMNVDPVSFNYDDQAWAYVNANHRCNFESYDSGSRQGVCGFTCWMKLGKSLRSRLWQHGAFRIRRCFEYRVYEEIEFTHTCGSEPDWVLPSSENSPNTKTVITSSHIIMSYWRHSGFRLRFWALGELFPRTMEAQVSQYREEERLIPGHMVYHRCTANNVITFILLVPLVPRV